MKQMIKEHKKILVAIAVALMLTTTIGTTLAYFTTYTSAYGIRPILIGSSTEIIEELEDMDKVVTIKNTGKTDVYVRVQAFSGSDTKVSVSGGDWIDGEDGWYYYKSILKPEEISTPLRAAVEAVSDAEQFQVVVVHESLQAFNPNIGAVEAFKNKPVTPSEKDDTSADNAGNDAGSEAENTNSTPVESTEGGEANE